MKIWVLIIDSYYGIEEMFNHVVVADTLEDALMKAARLELKDGDDRPLGEIYEWLEDGMDYWIEIDIDEDLGMFVGSKTHRK